MDKIVKYNLNNESKRTIAKTMHLHSFELWNFVREASCVEWKGFIIYSEMA